MAPKPNELLGNLLRREHKVDVSGSDGALWHAGVGRGSAVLRHGDPARFLDRLGATRTVGARPGKDHADNVDTMHLGQRAEKGVDWQVDTAPTLPRHQPQMPVRYGHRRIWRDHIRMIGSDTHPILGEDHWNSGISLEQRRQ